MQTTNNTQDNLMIPKQWFDGQYFYIVYSYGQPAVYCTAPGEAWYYALQLQEQDCDFSIYDFLGKECSKYCEESYEQWKLKYIPF